MRSFSKNSVKRENYNSKEQKQKCYNSSSNRWLSLVGIGPGGLSHLTLKAKEIINKSEIVVGYKKYIELIEELLYNKEKIISTPMKKEIDRCEVAIDFALKGKNTVIICSGDSGIYGLAGLVFELLEKKDLLSRICVKVIPGVPAFVAGAAALGAPIMHDFASISLSDLLTPWKVIENRIFCCAKGDFITILYNPKSKKRQWQIEKALEIIKKFRDPSTPVGIVKNITRKEEKILITTLEKVPVEEIDMFTLVIVGNSTTKNIGKYIVTPRGYLNKYCL